MKSMKEYISNLEEQLSRAQDYQQVAALINSAVLNLGEGFQLLKFKDEFINRLEGHSPFDYDSTQWSCFRYALVLLRQIQVREEEVAT